MTRLAIEAHGPGKPGWLPTAATGAASGLLPAFTLRAFSRARRRFVEEL